MTKKYQLILYFVLVGLLVLTGCSELTKQPVNGNPTPNQFDSAEQVKVHILDIGQGDAILIQSTKENILIDGGNKGQGENVIQYLKKFNVKQLNAVISTHQDADHIGGLADVIDAFPVKSVFAPRVTHTTFAYRNFLQSVKAKQLKIHVAKEGISIPVEENMLKLQFIGPIKEYVQSDLNDWSAVLLMQYGVNKFLFTGDAETRAEEDMLAAHLIPKVDVLKVSHHGAKEATNANFLSQAKPTYAAISVGTDNRYDHPTSEALNRLKKAHAKIYRTDEDGTITFSSNGKNISVKEEK